MKTNKFPRQIEDWLEESEGDEEALVDLISDFFETATPSEVTDAAKYFAKELLTSNDNEEE